MLKIPCHFPEDGIDTNSKNGLKKRCVSTERRIGLQETVNQDVLQRQDYFRGRNPSVTNCHSLYQMISCSLDLKTMVLYNVGRLQEKDTKGITPESPSLPKGTQG